MIMTIMMMMRIMILIIMIIIIFNTIVPYKLVIKLETLGLDPALCYWVLDFLTDRPPSGEGR